MPCVKVKNDTHVPLHIALRHISPIHFVNNVPPGGEAVFEHVGRVWFTVEARVARGSAHGQAQTTDADERNASLVTSDGTSTPPASSYSKIEQAKSLTTAAIDKIRHHAKSPVHRDGNEYTMFQSVAAPVAVSVAALSLGAGAVYIGMAASTAGGVGAALSTASAQISAAAASSAPTTQRLVKYAKKGQKVVQIGHVLGIGGGALAGTSLAGHQQKDEEEKQSKAMVSAANKESGQVANTSADNSTNGGFLGPEDADRVKAIKDILKPLIEKPVVRSHGWYMKHDRTIRIQGGPQASEVEDWLVIETDTVTPFEIVADRIDEDGQQTDAPNQSDDPALLELQQSGEATTTSTSHQGGQIVEKHDPLQTGK